MELIAIKGCVVTIDAMGCQQDIAKNVIGHEADYILAVKENQKQLYQDEFRFGKDMDIDVHQDLGHGRIETRTCSVINDFKFVGNHGK